MKIAFLISLFPLLSWGQTYFHECHQAEFIKHSYYSLCYDELHEQARWTEHKLSPQNLNGTESRTNDFREDPKVSTGSAGKYDYRGSGYDRGHLVPAGDMKQNYTSMSESFFMSNMSPQLPGFNRGVWRRVENQVRRFVQSDELIVLTGPILETSLPDINGISIPNKFFKIIYDAKKNYMLGFLLLNEKSSSDIKSFVVSVDEIERESGINFFSNMRIELQDRLEAMSDWPSFDI